MLMLSSVARHPGAFGTGTVSSHIVHTFPASSRFILNGNLTAKQPRQGQRTPVVVLCVSAGNGGKFSSFLVFSPLNAGPFEIILSKCSLSRLREI